MEMSNSRTRIYKKRHSVKSIYTSNIRHKTLTIYNSPLNTCGMNGTPQPIRWHDDDTFDQSSLVYYDNISIFRDVNKPRVRDSTTR